MTANTAAESAKAKVYKENPLKKKYQLEKKERSLTVIKKQMRDSQRTMKKTTDANIKQSLQKRIEALESEISNYASLQTELKLTEKYKYVKFVELKKVEKAIRKGVDADCEQKVNLENQKAYIEFFPKDLKYISLFPLKDDEKSQIERETIMKDIIERKNQGLLVDGYVFRSKVKAEKIAGPEAPLQDDFFMEE